jgi:hypothetical protein
MRVPYEILADNVEKLYQKQFDENDTAAIEEHITYIEKFIESCGWSIEEYMERWLREDPSIELN